MSGVLTGNFGNWISLSADGIPLPVTTGGTATMFDLKADDFASAGGGTQTLLVATGQLPLVVADPTAGVVYPQSPSGTFSVNPVQPLLMTSADGKTNSLLCYGRAVALGTVASTDSSGNSVAGPPLRFFVKVGMARPAVAAFLCRHK